MKQFLKWKWFSLATMGALFFWRPGATENKDKETPANQIADAAAEAVVEIATEADVLENSSAAAIAVGDGAGDATAATAGVADLDIGFFF